MWKSLLIPILFAILLSFSSGCSINKTEGTSPASCANSFVVWNGYTYNASKDYVDADKIDKEIGTVTVYPDKEGIYKGNFSNIYKQGTKYYSIKGINTDKIKPSPSKKKSASIEKRLGTTSTVWNNPLFKKYNQGPNF